MSAEQAGANHAGNDEEHSFEIGVMVMAAIFRYSKEEELE